MALNRVALHGRVVRDLELRHTDAGTAVTSFSVAVDRDFKNKSTGERQADFFDVQCWRATAEFAVNYLSKGAQVVVDGRLQTREWTDKDGNKRRNVDILADSIYLAGARQERRAVNVDAGEFEEVGDDGELPF